MKQAPAIIEEGFRARSDDITGWMCQGCHHFMTFLSLNGGCANCERKDALYPVKTFERTKEETDAVTDQQRFHPLQGEFDPFDPLSQLGKPLSLAQLMEVLKKSIPGTIARPAINGLGKRVMALYVPDRGPASVTQHLTNYEQKNSLRFVCCCEPELMPEWDVVQQGEDGRPVGQVRGWRSVLGTFYRAGLMPFVPDDGNRLSYWQIRESRPKETGF
jgi:hypothetical protein